MTEPRTSPRVARGVLLVLVLGLVAVAVPTVPAVWNRSPPWWWGVTDQTEPTAPWWDEKDH